MSGESKPALGSVVAFVAFRGVFFSFYRLLASSSCFSFFVLLRFFVEMPRLSPSRKPPLEFCQFHVILLA